MENAQGVSGVVEQEYKASPEEPIVEFAKQGDMTVSELREGLQTFIMQTSQIRPISFQVAINALMDLYCMAMLSFQTKEEAVKNMKDHFDKIIQIIADGQMGPGLVKES